MFNWLRGFTRILVVAIAVCAAKPIDAGLVVTIDPDGAYWPEPETGNVIAAGPAVIKAVPDDLPQGLFNSGLWPTSVDLSAGKVASQTFTPEESFRLGSIVMLADGAGTYDETTQQHIPLSLHLYELVPTSEGAATLPGSYNLLAAGPDNGPAVDLFGGGDGIAFEYEGGPMFEYQFVGLNFTDADQVLLEAGKMYAFEVRGNELFGAFNPVRLSGASVDPSPYAGGDGYFSVDSDPASVRTQFDSASRDLYLAIYPAEETNPPLQPGDFNGDGNVDGADFVIWQTNFPNNSGEATLATGDANGDGNVDGADFVIWQTNFPTVAGSITAVPEPNAILLAALALPVSLGIRRRLKANRQRLRPPRRRPAFCAASLGACPRSLRLAPDCG